MLKFSEFFNFYRAPGEISVLEIRALAFEVGDFPNIFLKFWGFGGSFSYKNISYKKTF